MTTGKHNADVNYDPLDDNCAAREAWILAMKKHADKHFNRHKEAQSGSLHFHHNDVEHSNRVNPHPYGNEQSEQRVPSPSKDLSDSKAPRMPKMLKEQVRRQTDEGQAARRHDYQRKANQ